ncbi:YjcQ protein [Streptococcus varani]|uniref:YjcQ protein n=1 Tax=Streptococcus varani TaxID=1608583 RepID=A0A0E4H649_9STRE|nr:YjcQ family protein [Streptococcus varani]CQR25881.1 YjcQ protein [Streptococcus varani]
MAKDDYHVIVYQILAYLYNCLKKGLDVDTKHLQPQGKLFNINSIYWRFILFNLMNDGYIDGITLTKVWGEKYPQVDDLENIGITPAGIQFLTDNSFMEKAKELLKDTKSIIPFI